MNNSEIKDAIRAIANKAGKKITIKAVTEAYEKHLPEKQEQLGALGLAETAIQFATFLEIGKLYDIPHAEIEELVNINEDSLITEVEEEVELPTDNISLIMQETGLPENEIQDMISAKVEELKGLISDEGALFLVGKELGVDVQIDKEEADLPVTEAKSWNDFMRKSGSNDGEYPVKHFLKVDYGGRFTISLDKTDLPKPQKDNYDNDVYPLDVTLHKLEPEFWKENVFEAGKSDKSKERAGQPMYVEGDQYTLWASETLLKYISEAFNGAPDKRKFVFEKKRIKVNGKSRVGYPTKLVE